MIRKYAVIGGGIGGCSIAALLNAHGEDVVLIEKEPTLGGCASTFIRNGHPYNAGATTVAGYHEGGILRRVFETVGVTPELISTDPAITIMHGQKNCKRYRHLDRFIQEMEQCYPHPKHGEFWQLVHTISETFYGMEGYYYSNRSWLKKIVSLMSYFPLLRKFRPYLLSNAHEFITQFYGDISSEFIDFLDAQILIVTQATSEKINFFTAALALGYTFSETHYPIGGMGAVCDSLTSKIPDVRKECKVLTISRDKGIYTISTSHGNIRTRNLIMGTSHYESSTWFDDEEIQNYYTKFKFLDNHQSAFVLYMTIRSTEHFGHHYQLIADSVLPFTLSKSLFVSLSDKNDRQMAQEGEYRITASIHTDSRYWLELSSSRYKAQKKELHDLLQGWICDRLILSNDSIVESFAATPKTFSRYINRTQLGGNPLTLSNLLPRLPSNDTPIKGFYQVGDTSYAAQGWPGVVMGAFNCMRLINGAS